MANELQNSQPLYEQIKLAIEKRIRGDEWPADFRVPSEESLAEEFGASSLTVRRALRELQSEGMLVRIQGRGTFVVGPRMQCAIFDLPDVSEEIALSGGVHTSEVLFLGVVPPESLFAGMLPLPYDGPVYHSRLLHKEDGTPIQIEDRFVNSVEAPDYLKQDFTRITPHAYLLRETEVTYVDNTIRAIRADEDSRRALEIDGNQPCLLLDRRTWRDGVPVTRSRFLYPGDRYRLRSSHEATPSRTGATQQRGAAASRRIR
ncbi:UTRA domain-containing protein [Aquamicrobium terrae]|uniref:GntR family histidine utilization transcriptional repressor n=1 Tax=Aquamicrobium terrae TaxID=1324945 RepID=A0ABV2N125_9HYPH